MRIFGKSELTTVDLHSELQFSLVRRIGLFELTAGPIILLLALFFGWRWHRPWLLVSSGIGLISLAANWMRGRATELRVTNNEFVTTGNVGRMFSSEVRVPASEVRSIGYEPGGEHNPSGLYVRRGWRGICILPGVNSKQAGEVAWAIYRRFPEIGSGDPNPNSLLFGKQNELTRLGLSDPQSRDPDTGV